MSFIGQKPEFTAWCGDDEAETVRLLHGPDGTGRPASRSRWPSGSPTPAGSAAWYPPRVRHPRHDTDKATADQVAELKATLSTRKAELARLDADLTAIDRIDTERGWFAALRAALHTCCQGGAGQRVARATRLAGLAHTAGHHSRRRGRRPQCSAGMVMAGVGRRRRGRTGPGRDGVAQAHRVHRNSAQALLRRKDELDKDIRDADDELGRIEPAHRLGRLLAEISTAERYESFRGLTGRIHHDLRRLSEDLTDARQDWLDKGGQSRPPLQRIVLYVDDLDRSGQHPRRI